MEHEPVREETVDPYEWGCKRIKTVACPEVVAIVRVPTPEWDARRQHTLGLNDERQLLLAEIRTMDVGSVLDEERECSEDDNKNDK